METIDVEIISATECKSLNPLGKEPNQFSNKYRGLDNPWWEFRNDLRDWKKAESERKVYKIVKAIEKIPYTNEVVETDIKDVELIIGSIHKAQVNETNEAIIL